MKNTFSTFIILALIVVTTAAFVRCWNYGIIDLDDYCYVTVKPLVCQWAGWDTIRFAFTDMSDSIWMPLTWLSYAFDCAMFGRWYGGFHLHSIFIHVINCLLVWLLLRMLTAHKGDGLRIRLACFVATLVWAVHPLRCESVVFIASRKDVLSFMWETLALLLWIKGSRAETHRKIAFLTVLSFALYIMGFMCKPSVMTFPILCLIIDIFIERKVYLLRYPLLLGTMIFFGWFATIQQDVSATQAFAAEPLFDRLMDASAAFGIYMRNMFCPLWLAPQCVKRWPSPPHFLWPGLLISAVWGFFILRRTMDYWYCRDARFSCLKYENLPVVLTVHSGIDYIFAGMLWYVVALAPMIGIANFGYHAFADRFTYIPSVGLSLLVAVVLAWAIEKKGKVLILALCTIVIAACVGLTWHQTGYWKDDYTLFSHTLEVDGDDNAAAHGVLANWYFEFPHDLKKSVEHFEKAARQDLMCILGSYEIFILALSESGQQDKICEMMKLCDVMIERTYGPEQSMRILRGDAELNEKFGMVRTLYRAAKTAWWLTDPSSYPLAKEVLDSIEKQKHLESDTIWLYLRWKYYKQTGENKKAEILFKKLLADGKPGYAQFRFLRNSSK